MMSCILTTSHTRWGNEKTDHMRVSAHIRGGRPCLVCCLVERRCQYRSQVHPWPSANLGQSANSSEGPWRASATCDSFLATPTHHAISPHCPCHSWSGRRLHFSPETSKQASEMIEAWLLVLARALSKAQTSCVCCIWRRIISTLKLLDWSQCFMSALVNSLSLLYLLWH